MGARSERDEQALVWARLVAEKLRDDPESLELVTKLIERLAKKESIRRRRV